MRRGIIRIVAGIIMIVLQILAVIGNSLADNSYDPTIYSTNILYNMLYYIGYYSVGITGVILLFFGIRIYVRFRYSELVLHSKTNAAHTVARWIMFGVSALLFLLYVGYFIYAWPDFSIFTILMIFATLSFALYMLFYVYEKPCCLFSTALILLGVTYLYSISNFVNSKIYLSDIEYVLYTILGTIPRLITGVLYIIIAVKLYKEIFSVKTIKILSLVAFAFELVNRVLCNLIIFRYFYFYLADILFIMLIVGILLYTGVFKLNTFKESSITDTDDTVRFCRKCGDKLIDGSKFCRKCGTQIVNQQEGTN